MELKQLECFAAVVKYGSFTVAAQHLYLSQPTVSAHVRTLEEELGRRLLIRTTKSLEVTPKGREVYDCAVKMLSLQTRIRRACAPDEEHIIRLGASTIPSAYILPSCCRSSAAAARMCISPSPRPTVRAWWKGWRTAFSTLACWA